VDSSPAEAPDKVRAVASSPSPDNRAKVSWRMPDAAARSRGEEQVATAPADSRRIRLPVAVTNEAGGWEVANSARSIVAR